jgi:hypothetical protein
MEAEAAAEENFFFDLSLDGDLRLSIAIHFEELTIGLELTIGISA